MILLSRGHLAKSGDIFGCHRCLWEWEGGGSANGQQVEARDAAKPPTIHGTAPQDIKALWSHMGIVLRLRNSGVMQCDLII